MLLIINQPDSVFSALIGGGEKAIALAIKLWAIYAVWLGLLKLVETTALDKKLARFFNPLLKFLFGDINNNIKNQLSINLTGNIFGIGSASVPSGIEAMYLMHKEKPSTTPTYAMSMLILVNSCNLQIIPSTIIGLRMLNDSYQPASIIFPSILVSIVSLIFGITLIKVFCKRIDK